MRETDLYPPVKAFLEAQGFEVKGEIGDCDVVAMREDEPPVLVELKARLSLDLLLQGVDRQRISDHVYLAVPPLPARTSRRRRREIVALCRRLGLGLMIVRIGRAATVEVLAEPGPYSPRPQRKRLSRLLGEFARRVGDPSTGGADKRTGRMTAYRQDALRLARFLSAEGPSKAAHVAGETGVARARAILYRDVYGWFERHGTGVYALAPAGEAALTENAEALAALAAVEGAAD